MNKHLLELKQIKSERLMSEEKLRKDDGFLNNYQEIDEQNFDLENYNENSININISNLKNDEIHLDFEQYKKDINITTENKKKNLADVYTFSKKIKEEKIKIKFETRYQSIINEEKERLEEIREKKKEDLINSFKLKIQQRKSKINEEYQLNKNEQMEKNNQNSSELNKKIKQIEKEVNEKKIILNELNKNEDYSSMYESEVSQLESGFKAKLKAYKLVLDSELNEKSDKLKCLFNSKIREFKNSSKKSFVDPSDKSLITPENILKEKKKIILSSHEQKLQNYKETITMHFNNCSEQEKEEAINALNIILHNMKENYDNLKYFYDEQKFLFKTEINIISISNLINKQRHIFDNKNSIFKNLFDQNYFLLKKKIREIENSKDLSSFTNKELILNKITELLFLLLFENIYDYLQTDLNSDKEVIIYCLDDLIAKCERIISNLDFDKKVQLNMLICNPNFSF